MSAIVSREIRQSALRNNFEFITNSSSVRMMNKFVYVNIRLKIR